jgi:hypothetical protein
LNVLQKKHFSGKTLRNQGDLRRGGNELERAGAMSLRVYEIPHQVCGWKESGKTLRRNITAIGFRSCSFAWHGSCSLFGETRSKEVDMNISGMAAMEKTHGQI